MGGQVDKPFRSTDLPVELRIAVLNYTSLVTPEKLVYWGNQGWYLDLDHVIRKTRYQHVKRQYHSWDYPTAFFLVSKSFSQVAFSVFYKENRFAVKKMSTLAADQDMDTTEPPLPNVFFQKLYLVPSLSSLRSRNIEVEFSDAGWRHIAGIIAPKLTSLRSLTMVGRYELNDTIYNFDTSATIDQLRYLVESKLWPMHTTLGITVQRFVVHVHSGAGSWYAGRSPDWEPTYFFEKRNVSSNDSIRGSIKKHGDGLARSVVMDSSDETLFVEGIVIIFPEYPTQA